MFLKNHILMNMRPNYDGLRQLVSYIRTAYDTQKYTLIEIGSYAGQSTIFFAQFFKQVISIDPFINDYDSKDQTCAFMPLESVYEKFIDNIKSHINILHIKKTSDDAIADIIQMQIKNILVVYIDGAHTYEQVKKDIQNYKNVIITNGYLCGHDYHDTNWQEVKIAINEFQKPDAVFCDSSWLIQKPFQYK